MGAGVDLIGWLFNDDEDEDIIGSSGEVEGSIGAKLGNELVDGVVTGEGGILLTASAGPTVGGKGLGMGFSTGFVKPSFISCTRKEKFL